MGDLPYESLIGISYGLVTGFGPALVVGLAAIGVGLVGDRSLPTPVGVVVTVTGALATGSAIEIFSLNAGVAGATRLAMASTVAGLLGLVATSHGTRIATELPRDRTFPIVRGRALSADAIDAVDAVGQVTVRPTGAIREFEGYPPLSPGLRTALEEGSWRFPADLQLTELERRIERRLETEYGLSLVDVSIDGRGRATIAAAPPAKGVATTLSEGTRAVTVSGLLPTGIERGDDVAIGVADTTVRGEVLAVGSAVTASDGETNSPDGSDENGIDASSDRRHANAGFDGGTGQLTVAVDTTDAGPLLEASRHRIVVLPSGHNHEFEAAALLEDAGTPITAIELTADDDDGGIDPAATLGVCSDEQWQFTVDASAASLESPDRAFVASSPREVRRDD